MAHLQARHTAFGNARSVGAAVALAALLMPDIGAAQQDDSPREIARRVADRIVTETVFDFKPALQPGEQEGFYTVDFFDTFGGSENGLYYARSVLVVDSTSDGDDLSGLALGITHSAGALKLTVGERVVYSAARSKDGTIHHLDYALVRPDTVVSLPLPQGVHRVSVKFAPSGPTALVRLGLVTEHSELAFEHAHLEAPAPTDPPESVRFLVIGPFDAGDAGFETVAGPDNDWLNFSAEYRGLENRVVRWDIPRFHLVRDHPERLEYSDWRYFSGTFLDAMFAVSDRFEGLDYSDYVNRHLEFFLEKRDVIAAERNDYNLIESAFGHYFRGSLLDDVGMQAVPFADRLLDQKRRGGSIGDDDAGLEIVKSVAAYVYEDARRLPDGTFARLNPDSLTVWADDLFMGSIILIRAAELLDRPEYLDEAVRQVTLMHRQLEDADSGLYWHGRFARTGEPSSSKWARANGWTMMAKTELLLNLDDDDPGFRTVLASFQSHATALLRVQCDDGRWRQVLDNPDTYLETSATAMFVRAFAEGIRNGWLPKEAYIEAVRRGWSALGHQVRDDGMVEGIVRGTPIFYSDEEYNRHPTRLNDPRGLGAVLHAAVAVDRLNEWLEEE
ncbi:MAG TPA: glycoside hydrolase family 88 protein [Rhodothermales bacterium]|nr:glycoside hydrolase family 88 protein [Rhodothermales bacterium]